MVLVVRETGISLDDVLDMPTLEFNRLIESVMRIMYTQKIEQAWTSMVAAQGSEKGMRKWVEPWNELIDPDYEPANDIGEFLKDFGAGG